MKRLVLVICLLSAIVVSAETPITTVDCRDGSTQKACTTEYVNGGKLQIAKTGALMVVVLPTNGIDKRTYGRLIAVGNKGADPIDVNPAAMTMTWTNGTSSAASDADSAVDKAEKHQNTLNAFATVLDQMATGDDNAVAVDSNGGHSVAYDTSMAQERANARGDAIAVNADTLRSKILRRNTVHQNEVAHGLVLFAKPKSKDEKTNYPKTLTITVGQVQFLF